MTTSNEILVVDDNSDIRVLISGFLKDKGFSVREAANFDQAFIEINKKLPDIAVIDVKLDKGDNDGIELLTHIKKINACSHYIRKKATAMRWLFFYYLRLLLRLGFESFNCIIILQRKPDIIQTI